MFCICGIHNFWNTDKTFSNVLNRDSQSDEYLSAYNEDSTNPIKTMYFC